MTVQNAAEFLAQVGEDNDLTTLIENISTPEELIDYAQTQGYEFTQDDLKEVETMMESDELSEDDLEAIAGGEVRFRQYQLSDQQLETIVQGVKQVYRFVKSLW